MVHVAKLVGVFNTAHGPFCYIPSALWNSERAKRVLRSDVPFDDDEENRRKAERINHGFAVLRDKLAAAKPDVIVIYGNDQREIFDFSNYPMLSVLACPEFYGAVLDNASRAYGSEEEQRVTYKGDQQFGAQLILGLNERGFDPAFSLDMPATGHGMPHAVTNPMRSLTDLSIPIVPIMLNCYYTPQITGRRSYEIGRAIGDIVASDGSERRVAVIGSGGLWHTPGERYTYIDEAFDRTMLERMCAGDAKGMAAHFDGYRVPPDDVSQQLASRGWRSEALRAAGFESTGLPAPGGPQGGTRETCCWIAAAAAAEGRVGTLVDYVPVYSSPIGLGFAYWEIAA